MDPESNYILRLITKAYCESGKDRSEEINIFLEKIEYFSDLDQNPCNNLNDALNDQTFISKLRNGDIWKYVNKNVIVGSLDIFVDGIREGFNLVQILEEVQKFLKNCKIYDFLNIILIINFLITVISSSGLIPKIISGIVTVGMGSLSYITKNYLEPKQTEKYYPKNYVGKVLNLFSIKEKNTQYKIELGKRKIDKIKILDKHGVDYRILALSDFSGRMSPTVSDDVIDNCFELISNYEANVKNKYDEGNYHYCSFGVCKNLGFGIELDRIYALALQYYANNINKPKKPIKVSTESLKIPKFVLNDPLVTKLAYQYMTGKIEGLEISSPPVIIKYQEYYFVVEEVYKMAIFAIVNCKAIYNLEILDIGLGGLEEMELKYEFQKAYENAETIHKNICENLKINDNFDQIYLFICLISCDKYEDNFTTRAYESIDSLPFENFDDNRDVIYCLDRYSEIISGNHEILDTNERKQKIGESVICYTNYLRNYVEALNKQGSGLQILFPDDNDTRKIVKLDDVFISEKLISQDKIFGIFNYLTPQILKETLLIAFNIWGDFYPTFDSDYLILIYLVKYINPNFETLFLCPKNPLIDQRLDYKEYVENTFSQIIGDNTGQDNINNYVIEKFTKNCPTFNKVTRKSSSSSSLSAT